MTIKELENSGKFEVVMFDGEENDKGNKKNRLNMLMI